MANKRHDKINMEWTEYTAEDFTNLTPEQCESMARIFTAQSRRLAEADYAHTTLQRVIETLTGMDSIDACIKVDGVDYIAMSMEQ